MNSLRALLAFASLTACGTSSPPSDAGSDASNATDSGSEETSDAPASCMHNVQCGSNNFCAHPAGQCGSVGTCVSDVGECDLIPVCGCDKKTYANGCDALANDVAIDYFGACE